jgi:NADH:ubiquinone oxidoreductase subunit K
MAKITVSLSRTIGLVLLILGAISLLGAIVYSSTILALIGLGLIFWGIILTYVQTSEYTRTAILDTTVMPLLTTLDETLKTLDYTGKAIYLPPKYFNDPETTKIYISKEYNDTLPQPETTQKLELEFSHKNAQGTLITPPAAELTKLFETTLGTSFLNINLQDLQKRLPKVLIEDLEVMTDIEFKPVISNETEKTIEPSKADYDKILVKFTTMTYKNICKKAHALSAIHANVGCPLTSALASALAKTTGKPVSIEKHEVSEDGATTQLEYLVLKEET